MAESAAIEDIRDEDGRLQPEFVAKVRACITAGDGASSPASTYPAVLQTLLGASFLVFFYNAAVSLTRGEPAPVNPWGARTLDWSTESPPGHGNFTTPPVVTSGPYDFTKPAPYFGKPEYAPQSQH